MSDNKASINVLKSNNEADEKKIKFLEDMRKPKEKHDIIPDNKVTSEKGK